MRRDLGELAAALATAVIHVLPLERLYPEIVEIVVLAGGWLGYLVWLAVRDRERLAQMGFRREDARPTALWCALVLTAVSAGAAAYGASVGTLRLHPHMLILMALYPIWGWIQQWLVLGVLARQLRPRVPAVVTVAITAVVFGLLHVPDVTLAIGTFGLGLLITPIYLRYRNLWPIGVLHGWLAIPFYFWILGENPWATVTG